MAIVARVADRRRARPRRAAILFAATVVATLLASAGCDDAAIPASTFRARVAAHGPWPPAAAEDPSNRVFDSDAAAAFGRRLFHDSRLSANGYVACVTCHQTDRAWTDANVHAQGLAPVPRNTPTLDNVAWQRLFGWTGASDSLWMANLRPLLDPREMGGNAANVAQVVRTGIGLPCRYRDAFGRDPATVDDETVMVDVAKAIAAFERTLTSGRTPFDEYRDALLRGDTAAMRRYPDAAQRGLRLFVGRGGCASCHAGATFSDGSFHRFDEREERGLARGVELTAHAAAADAADAAARDLFVNRFNLAGRYNDAPERTRDRIDTRGASVAAGAAAARRTAAQATTAPGVRVPGLRNVAVTAPYLHDGSLATLREAVRHRDGIDGRGHAAASALTDREVDDVVAFLHTLTDAAGARRPRQWPGMPTECEPGQ